MPLTVAVMPSKMPSACVQYVYMFFTWPHHPTKNTSDPRLGPRGTAACMHAHDGSVKKKKKKKGVPGMRRTVPVKVMVAVWPELKTQTGSVS